MARYRTKPTEIEAMQFLGPEFGTKEQAATFSKWLEENVSDKQVVTLAYDKLFIQTPEGEMRANPGDWIIKGLIGEIYPCKPEVFDMKYEPVA